MSTSIHQVLNLPPKGSALSLGPVKIDSVFPPSVTKTGKSMRNITVSDSSGKSKMSLWGAAANLNINQGDTVTFVGAIKRNDYNGVTSITAENVTIEGGESAQSAPTGNSAPSNSGSSSSGKISLDVMARQIALFTYELQQALIHMEIDNQIVNKITENAPQIAALWWFGEKQLKEPEQVDSEAGF
jgi:hypothetical protein